MSPNPSDSLIEGRDTVCSDGRENWNGSEIFPPVEIVVLVLKKNLQNLESDLSNTLNEDLLSDQSR